LLRFPRKTSKNRRSGGSFTRESCNGPGNRDFRGTLERKNLQARKAPGSGSKKRVKTTILSGFLLSLVVFIVILD
jgi:hypothetical protein